MDLRKIKLINFKNFKNESCDIKDGFTLIVGENGAGKTNLLESINYLYTGEGFNKVFNDHINYNEKYSLISGIFEEGIRKIEKTIALQKINDETTISRNINTNKVKNKKVFKTHNTVLFEPYDLFIIDATPSVRRKFLDNIIISISDEYERLIYSYQKLLINRNNLLKEEKINYTLLEVIDDKMIEKIIDIARYREKYIKILNELANIHIKSIDETYNLQLSMKYSYDIENIKRDFKNRLSEDIYKKHTNIGSHLDDININFKNNSAKNFSSRGQKRAVIISLKLANVDILKKLSELETVLLLDDLMYEFDIIKNKKIFELISKFRAFATSTVKHDADNIIYIKDNKLDK